MLFTLKKNLIKKNQKRFIKEIFFHKRIEFMKNKKYKKNNK